MDGRTGYGNCLEQANNIIRLDSFVLKTNLLQYDMATAKAVLRYKDIEPFFHETTLRVTLWLFKCFLSGLQLYKKIPG